MLDRKKAVIGISGGVDSSVAAYLLKQKGYDVTGVFFNLWESIDGGRFKSFSKKNEEDARKVAEKLGIEFVVKNFEEAFKKEVVEYFIDEYMAGRTPNPCVKCNKTVKFKYLVQTADEIGAFHIATGHYVRVEYDNALNRFLVKKTENEKDQSYMFYTLSQEVLSRLVMPLGEIEDKSIVRKMADDLDLDTAKKKDSQEICFIQDNDYGAFIRRNVSNEFAEGNFVDGDGNVLGRHKGIPFYTVGQRKKLGVSLGKPAYVKEINVDSNSIMLTDNSALFSSSLVAYNVNGIKYEDIPEGKLFDIKTRYTARPAKGYVRLVGMNRIEIVFEEPQRAVTPGQSVVLYEGNDLVGGGVIEKTVG